MKILFLGDIVAKPGCEAVKKFLPKKIQENKINFVIVNGENAANNGLGITEEAWDAVVAVLLDTLNAFNVEEGDIQLIVAAVASKKPLIV